MKFRLIGTSIGGIAGSSFGIAGFGGAIAGTIPFAIIGFFIGWFLDSKWITGSNENFEKASKELESGNKDNGIWAKALVASDGDEKKASARYIKYRVKQFEEDEKRRRQIQQEQIEHEQQIEEGKWIANIYSEIDSMKNELDVLWPTAYTRRRILTNRYSFLIFLLMCPILGYFLYNSPAEINIGILLLKYLCLLIPSILLARIMARVVSSASFMQLSTHINKINTMYKSINDDSNYSIPKDWGLELLLIFVSIFAVAYLLE